MGYTFRDGRLPPQKALEIIVCYMKRMITPVYLGILSVEVGWSLARTQEMMERLEDARCVHRLDETRLRHLGMRPESVVYALGPRM